MLILGIDTGIASVGWAMIEISEGSLVIRGLGTWMFDAPETDKEHRPKSEIRREKRGQRRVIRRRRQRMAAIRRLLVAHGLLPDAGREALKQPGLDPWALRVAGLDRRLSDLEFAVVLGHLAGHRGFKSNAKAPKESNAAEESKMKQEMAKTCDRLAQWRTVAEMLVKDEAFQGRMHNRDGDYSRSILRDDLAAETRSLFSAQRRLGHNRAGEDLLAEFLEKAFTQRPLRDSDDKVGPCPFEPTQRRAAKHSFSFEMFRLLSRLAVLEVTEGRISRRLTHQEITAAAANFGATAKLSFTALRKKIGLGSAFRFATVKPEEEGRDVVARSGEAAAGTAALRTVVGEKAWAALLLTPDRLDQIAAVLSFREDKATICKGLEEAGVEPLVIGMIMDALEPGKSRLGKFSGAAHISAQAARVLIPHLSQGLVYSEACQAAGYDHTASRERSAFTTGQTGKAALAAIIRESRISPDLVGSPVARKALLESVKQVKAVIEIYGVPDAIHVELARDVGKSIEERRKIEAGIEKRNKQKDRMRKEFANDIGRPPENAEELLRFELWKEQDGFCLYTGEYISPKQIVAGDNSVQIDHILPWSRFGDDSYLNKTLCSFAANQAKKGRTPYEWFTAERSPEDWELFTARVEGIKYMKGLKKRNYLLKDGSAEVAERFRNRNLNDTRWATRLLAEALRALYPADEGKRRVYARSGSITNRLRQGWGLQWIKKDDDGERIPDDRHHALDALLVAACSESMLQRLTNAFQKSEARGDRRDFQALDQPCPGFREQALRAVGDVFVARAERHRARGRAHKDTIRQIVIREGVETVYERRRIADLKLADLDKIKDLERNKGIRDALAAWIEAGKPLATPPVSPQGHPILKVRLKAKQKVDVAIRGGAAERGEMAGVDVFRKTDAKGKTTYHLVPIYPHQIVGSETPPDRAIIAAKPEEKWTLITAEFEFLFRLSSHSYVVVTKPNGEIIEGYFKGVDRANGGISLATEPHNLAVVRHGIGTKTLQAIQKFHINRLGRRSEIVREVRTWRGKACI